MPRILLSTVPLLILARAMAQAPPIDVLWSAFLPYGSTSYDLGGQGCRISMDGNTTAWAVNDDLGLNATMEDEVVWRFDSNGLILDTSSPYASFNCGSFDRMVDFRLSNDVPLGLHWKQTLAGGYGFCLFVEGGLVFQSSFAEDLDTGDHPAGLFFDGTSAYITSWRDSSATSVDHHRITAVDMEANAVWDRYYPPTQFQRLGQITGYNGALAVTDFPLLHRFEVTNGDLLGSSALYAGTPGQGAVQVKDGELYWAAQADGTLHYGKLDAAGNVLWTGTHAAIWAETQGRERFQRALAVDDLGRMWIPSGYDTSPGRLLRIGSDGSTVDSYSFGTTVSHVAGANGRIAFAGKFAPNDASSYLIVGMPQP